MAEAALAPHLVQGSGLDEQRRAHALALEILCKGFLRHLPSMLPNAHISTFQVGFRVVGGHSFHPMILFVDWERDKH